MKSLIFQMILAGAGGFFGSAARFLIGTFFSHPDGKFPYGTLIVNLTGCLAIGALAAFFEKHPIAAPDLQLLLITGFLGGFTTFSAFGFETLSLIQKNEIAFALINILLSLIGGLLLVWIGFKITARFEF